VTCNDVDALILFSTHLPLRLRYMKNQRSRPGNKQGNSLHGKACGMNQPRVTDTRLLEQFCGPRLFDAPSTRFCGPDFRIRTERRARLNFDDLLKKNEELVGARGFEPPTPRSRTERFGTLYLGIVAISRDLGNWGGN
jgi:hypothetical protein